MLGCRMKGNVSVEIDMVNMVESAIQSATNTAHLTTARNVGEFGRTLSTKLAIMTKKFIKFYNEVAWHQHCVLTKSMSIHFYECSTFISNDPITKHGFLPAILYFDNRFSF